MDYLSEHRDISPITGYQPKRSCGTPQNMTSVEFSADLSSVTGNSESGTSLSITIKSSTSSSPSQCSSSTSSEYHRGAVACAAVPETIMECESVLGKSSQPSYAPIDLIVDSDSSDASSDDMTDGSIDEEQRIKE